LGNFFNSQRYFLVGLFNQSINQSINRAADDAPAHVSLKTRTAG